VNRSSELSETAEFTVSSAAAALAAGAVSSEEMTRLALSRAESPRASAVFTRLRTEKALHEARASDELRSAGFLPSPIAGLPISVKDLFDITGEPTSAGSAVLADAEPAAHDAAVIRRLRLSGAVLLGRTNMTELAYSGLGLNPHFGTPVNPCDTTRARIPGGSSSGAAVSVALGIVPAALGTDTGGSVRIPASLCGLVGFKPTAARVPLQGTVPLSSSMDSIGPIARTVACCALLDAVLTGGTLEQSNTCFLEPYRIAVPQTLVWNELDEHTKRSTEAALQRLSRGGVKLVDVAVPEFLEILELNAQGGVQAAEAYAAHRKLLESSADRIDPRVRVRLERGRHITAAAYVDGLRSRKDVQRRLAERMRDVHFWVMPTVPQVAPPIEALATDSGYFSMNGRMLRNTSLVNFLDGCAISIPCHDPGTLPVGLSLAAGPFMDHHLLAAAARVEALLSPR
jgi:aspartyl-tRNA(Asn)/glutamyl-tRNA(Gln) amidotransferase subunit A